MRSARRGRQVSPETAEEEAVKGTAGAEPGGDNDYVDVYLKSKRSNTENFSDQDSAGGGGKTEDASKSTRARSRKKENIIIREGIMIKRTSVFIVLAIAFLGSSLYASVANDPMRGLTGKQFIKDMFLGWNLGNTMDCGGAETAWGNPVTTQAMIDVVHQGGFKTMREPVTWDSHFGAAPTYTIDATWMARVAAIANYALNDSMYVIINTHHDGWYDLAATGADSISVQAEVVAIWTQIATEFKDYSDYVIFEIFNEPNADASNQYGGGSAANRADLAAYQIAAVNAIRATGGNNATRKILLQGISASPIQASMATIPIVDSNILISIHTYDPVGFSMNCSPTTWGSASDSENIVSDLTNELSWTKTGCDIVGEWGSSSCDELASRVTHAYCYAQQTRDHEMCPVWWDDGAGFHILDRTSNPPSWAYPTIAAALLAGATSANFVASTINEPTKERTVSYDLQERAGIVNYSLPATSFVSLRLYTMQGRVVSTLVKSVQSAGKYAVKLPAKSISLGNYILELKAGNNFVTKRLTISQ
jgi:endoglucanase